MTRRPLIAALLAGAAGLWALPAAAAFTSLQLEPPAGILNPDINHDRGSLQVRFAASVTGTAQLSGDGIETVTLDYPQTGVTSTIQLRADAIPRINEWLTLTLDIVRDGAPQATTSVRVAKDATPPPPPSDQRAMPANEALIVTWSGGVFEPPPFSSNVERYRLFWSQQDLASALPVTVDGDVGLPPAILPASVSSVTIDFTNNYRIDGLRNGQTTYIAVEAIDHAGFTSGLELDADGRVRSVRGTPVTTQSLAELAEFTDMCFVVTAAFGAADSPWVDLYRDFRDGFLLALPGGESLVAAYYRHGPAWAAGLEERPLLRHGARLVLGIGAPLAGLAGLLGPGGSSLLGLFLAAGLFRRRRRTTGNRLGLLLLAAGLAVGTGIPADAAAAQAWSLRVAPMLPENAIDASVVGASYGDFYGPTGTWRIELDYVWSPLEDWGHLGFGGRVGLAMDNGRSLAVDSQTGQLIRTAETSRLLMVPMAALVRYRGDWVRDQVLVPTVGAGLDFWPWQEARETADEKIQNFTSGWHAEFQLELLLNWMERRAAAQMRDNYGITGTLLYGGYQYSRLDDFGKRRNFDLTHHSWTVGLRFILR